MAASDRNKRARTLAHLVFLVCGILAAWVITSLAISLLRGLGAGDVYDPATGARYVAPENPAGPAPEGSP